jgi:hypothetical protein
VVGSVKACPAIRLRRPAALTDPPGPYAIGAHTAVLTVRLRAMSGSRILVACVTAWVCFVLPASAGARIFPGDRAATHAYLQAVLAERRATATAGSASIAATEALAAQVKRECPGVLAGAPPHSKDEPVSDATREIDGEIVDATFGAAERVVHPILETFDRTVSRLRWSSRKLTRLLRSLAREAAVQSGIPTPDLCSDLRYWVASGYTKLSAGTVAYEREHSVADSITLLEPEPHEPTEDIFNTTALIRDRLKPYEDHRDKALAHKAFPPSSTLTDPRLKPLLEALSSVNAALGRTPAQPPS